MSKFLEIECISKKFESNSSFWGREKNFVHALDKVSLTVNEGETIGLVGESGCGKSTLGRCLTHLIMPDEGKITFQNSDISSLTGQELKAIRRQIQYIFQDPYASLNPRMTIENILLEPFKIHSIQGKNSRNLIIEILQKVGLAEDSLNKYPHEFSGGQRQRIGIARSLILKPKLLIADEPVSALDVSIQSQIINLLIDLRTQFNLSILFIAHDLSVVSHISHRVAVMYLGSIVEVATSEEVFRRPLHPYTQALIKCIPNIKASSKRFTSPITGDLASVKKLPRGCKFHPRCPYSTNLCAEVIPELRTLQKQHIVACHHAEKFV